MQVSELVLFNLRGFKFANMIFSPKINILIGENNSGKSTILKAIMFLQNITTLKLSDIRINQSSAHVTISFAGNTRDYFEPVYLDLINRSFGFKYSFNNNTGLQVFDRNISHLNLVSFTPNLEPKKFIYPFLSKRKVDEFNEQVGERFSNSVSGNFSHLSAKVDRLVSAGDWLPERKEYIEACEDVLGFPINSYPSVIGKNAAYVISKINNIPLASMGEGIANALGLILDLSMAERKLFLIEEPENDIHPKALKKLLNLILKKSETNQFIITTHSNIVLKYLGADPYNKIFNVKMRFEDRIPVSTITEIDNSPESRREVLEDLGYELLDFDISDTWLILEESSAESIIKDFLIPNFVPGLKDRLKLCSTGGVDKISARLDALYSLCLFLHLQKPLSNKIWVLIDDGEHEKKIVDQLKNKYTSWKPDRFIQLKEHHFENYYPNEFKAKFQEILQGDKQQRREAKRALLEEVKQWCKNNVDEAKESFSQSASEVINILKHIEKGISNP